MSQTSVAHAMGTSQPAIARIETAQENITLETLRRLVVALKGRFHVSMPPAECASGPIRPWWEIDRSPWTVVAVASRRAPETDQVIVGLERAHGLNLSQDTLSTGGGSILLEASSTPRTASGI
jgi:hypothetical protein